MSKKDLGNIGMLYESMVGDISPKNLFYGLKSMLDDGDNFELLEVNDTNAKDSLHCQFLYKGTRNIEVTAWYYDLKTKKSLNVIVYEDGDGMTNEYTYEVSYEASPRDIEVGAADEDGKISDTEWGYDPLIDSVVSFVKFVKDVLDENDRDDDEPEYDTTPSNPSKKRSPNLVGV